MKDGANTFSKCIETFLSLKYELRYQCSKQVWNYSCIFNPLKSGVYMSLNVMDTIYHLQQINYFLEISRIIIGIYFFKRNKAIFVTFSFLAEETQLILEEFWVNIGPDQPTLNIDISAPIWVTEMFQYILRRYLPHLSFAIPHGSLGFTIPELLKDF